MVEGVRQKGKERKGGGERKVKSSVVTVSKCFLSVGFGRFCRKNLGFRFGLGFHDKRVVKFFMTRVTVSYTHLTLPTILRV